MTPRDLRHFIKGVKAAVRAIKRNEMRRMISTTVFPDGEKAVTVVAIGDRAQELQELYEAWSDGDA